MKEVSTQELIDKITDKYGPIPYDWNWTDISYREHLSENFIREFQDKVSWGDISAHQILSEDFIREFQDKVNWPLISIYQELSEDFIREFKDKVDWDYISINQTLSEDFIEEFKFSLRTPYKINMDYLIRFNPDCPPGIKIKWYKEHGIIKKQDPETHEIEYHEVSEKPKDNSLEELKKLISMNLNEKITIAQLRDKETQDLIDKFTEIFGRNPDNWNWDYIAYNATLSENFIREFKDKVNWVDIGYKQKLSEDFIREFKDYVDWQYISFSQKLSEDFIREFKDNIDWSVFAKYNPNCPPELKIRYMKEHNIIKKQDPNTHEIEYHEIEPEKPKNNSLEELKKLISINLNEKITIAQVRDKETQDLVDKFTEEYWQNPDDWPWHVISISQKLSENFIREFKDKVNWNYISYYQTLSEDFIREFKNYVNWYCISVEQTLSEDFIREFKDKVNMISFIKLNKNCPPELRIRWMKENNVIKKQDPETHEIEYHETPIKPKDNSLEELKKLISINLNEKITIAQSRDKEIQDLVDKITEQYGPNPYDWNWDYISYYLKLSENFIREFKDKVDWSLISIHQNLSEDFIREFKDYVNWNCISYDQKLSEDFIREFKNRVDWAYISAKQKLSEDFIKEFKDKINIKFLAQYNPYCSPDIRIQWMKENNIIKKQDPNTHEIEYHEELVKPENNSLEELKKLISININEKIVIAQLRDKETQELVDKFTDKYGTSIANWDWYRISYYQKLSENFIREFKDKVDWDNISFSQKLSEDFIREFQNKVNWNFISQYQKLSESFIREFKDKVHWDNISFSQILSEDFIREFQNKVNWNFISQYQKLSENFIREFKDKVSWDYISQKQTLSEDFIREFKHDVDMRLFCKYNPSCSPDIRIRWMKENNIIKKQDPNTHEIEYHEEPVKPENNSLEELKKLISINFNEKIKIEGIEGQNEQNKEEICMPKITKIAQHIHKDDYPSIEDIASYTEAIKLFKQKGKISDPELEILIDNLPSPQNIRKSLSNNEIKIIFRTIWYLWHKITGINLIEDTKVEQKKETLEGNYWMIHKGVLMSGPNHYTIIKNNLDLFRSLLGIHAFALHEKMGSPPNELIKLVLDNGGIRIFVNQDRTAYFQLSAETYAKWGKQKIMKYEFHKKIVMVIDVDSPYKGWKSGLRISLK